MFRLGFIESIVILTIAAIIFAPWVFSRLRRTVDKSVTEYKRAQGSKAAADTGKAKDRK